ncbi:berberine bridge enzyme-like 21 [Senna tora]|uniref:Berberine bridge enzyme-like 21 n=1 Tax=Senna tora TaxID=362788 RepID=A0A834WEX8_9FABA|nr:berberine bridge enzyme-like 21 [Senna tora]
MAQSLNPYTYLHPLLLLLLLLHVSSPLADPSLYDSFLECLKTDTNPFDQSYVSDIVFAQSNVSYPNVFENYIRNTRFNTSSTPKPSLIITPPHEAHVQSTVICAKSVIPIQIKIRSGGHDYEGISYVSNHQPFIVLDLFNLHNITVDVQKNLVVVHAGATLGVLYYKIWNNSRTHGFPTGVGPTVGVGGHVSSGGYDNMLGRYGLSVDNVIDARIVDVNGRILDKESMGEDLFWAIKGGGGEDVGAKHNRSCRSVAGSRSPCGRQALDQAADVATELDGGKRFQNGESFGGDVVSRRCRRARDAIGETVSSAWAKEGELYETTWVESVLWWANYPLGTKPETLIDRNLNSADFLKRKSDYVQNPIPRSGLEVLWKKMIELGKTGLVFNPYGGRMGEIPSDATPFPHRAGNLFKIQYSVTWNPRSAFLAYKDLDIGINSFDENSYEEGEVYGLKYFNDNFERLVKVKTEVDPENFFRNEQSIPVLPRK